MASTSKAFKRCVHPALLVVEAGQDGAAGLKKKTGFS